LSSSVRACRPGSARRSRESRDTEWRRRLLLVALTLAIAAAAIAGLAGNAAARPATTAPGSLEIIRVVITAGKVAMDHGASAPRGSAAEFALTNKTGATARFVLLGHASKAIAPHGRGGLIVFLVRRGAFYATIKLSTHHTLRELFVVY